MIAALKNSFVSVVRTPQASQAFAEELWPCAGTELKSVVPKMRQASSDLLLLYLVFHLSGRKEEALLSRLCVATGVNGQNWSLWQKVKGSFDCGSALRAALLSFKKPPRPLGLPHEWTTLEVTINPMYSARKKTL